MEKEKSGERRKDGNMLKDGTERREKQDGEIIKDRRK